MKTEIWNDHKIRFVEKEGEWWAVAKDVAEALGYRDAHNMVRNLDKRERDTHVVSTPGGKQELLVISEFGIYEAVFNSRKPEAKEFKHWVYEMLKTLRQSTGIEGFQVFRMLDKEHQKEMMSNLQESIESVRKSRRQDFMKANTIANKAVSNRYGYPKMVKKGEMTPEMLVDRERILSDTVELMGINEKFHLGVSISEQIYRKHITSSQQRDKVEG